MTNGFLWISGSPFKFYVDSLASGFVTAYGPGLTHGVCGEACNFTISTKNAGSGIQSILQDIQNYEKRTSRFKAMTFIEYGSEKWEPTPMWTYYGCLAGGLSLAVEGPSKADISCHDNKDGTVSVSYLPLAPGEYKVSVKYADKHIRGSPYTAKITGN